MICPQKVMSDNVIESILKAIREAFVNLGETINEERTVNIRVNNTYYTYNLKSGYQIKCVLPETEEKQFYQFGNCEYYHRPEHCLCISCTFNRHGKMTDDEQLITDKFISMVRGWHKNDLMEYKKAEVDKYYVNIHGVLYMDYVDDDYDDGQSCYDNCCNKLYNELNSCLADDLMLYDWGEDGLIITK